MTETTSRHPRCGRRTLLKGALTMLISLGLVYGTNASSVDSQTPVPGSDAVLTVMPFSRNMTVFDSDSARGNNAADVPLSGDTDAPAGATIEGRVMLAGRGYTSPLIAGAASTSSADLTAAIKANGASFLSGWTPSSSADAPTLAASTTGLSVGTSFMGDTLFVTGFVDLGKETYDLGDYNIEVNSGATLLVRGVKCRSILVEDGGFLVADEVLAIGPNDGSFEANKSINVQTATSGDVIINTALIAGQATDAIGANGKATIRNVYIDAPSILATSTVHYDGAQHVNDIYGDFHIQNAYVNGDPTTRLLGTPGGVTLDETSNKRNAAFYAEAPNSTGVLRIDGALVETDGKFWVWSIKNGASMTATYIASSLGRSGNFRFYIPDGTPAANLGVQDTTDLAGNPVAISDHIGGNPATVLTGETEPTRDVVTAMVEPGGLVMQDWTAIGTVTRGGGSGATPNAWAGTITEGRSRYWLKPEVRVQGSRATAKTPNTFGVGLVLWVEEQSQVHRGLDTSGNGLGGDAVRDMITVGNEPGDFQFIYRGDDGDVATPGDGSLIHVHDGNKHTAPVSRMAETFFKGMGGVPVMIGFDTKSGSGAATPLNDFKDRTDDRGSAREWGPSATIFATLHADGAKVGSYYARPTTDEGPYSTLAAYYGLHRDTLQPIPELMTTLTDPSILEANPWTVPWRTGNKFHHTWFGADAMPELLEVDGNGKHRAQRMVGGVNSTEPFHSAGGSPLGSFQPNAPFAEDFPEKAIYVGHIWGAEKPDGDKHYWRESLEGMPRAYAGHAIGFMRMGGLLSDNTIPQWDTVTYAPDGSYIELASNAGPVTTRHLQENGLGADLFPEDPHVTPHVPGDIQVFGFTDAALRNLRAEIVDENGAPAVSGRLRVYSRDGQWNKYSTPEYLTKASGYNLGKSGYSGLYDQRDPNDNEKRTDYNAADFTFHYPIVDLGLPVFEGHIVQPPGPDFATWLADANDLTIDPPSDGGVAHRSLGTASSGTYGDFDFTVPVANVGQTDKLTIELDAFLNGVAPDGSGIGRLVLFATGDGRNTTGTQFYGGGTGSGLNLLQNDGDDTRGAFNAHYDQYPYNTRARTLIEYDFAAGTMTWYDWNGVAYKQVGTGSLSGPDTELADGAFFPKHTSGGGSSNDQFDGIVWGIRVWDTIGDGAGGGRGAIPTGNVVVGLEVDGAGTGLEVRTDYARPADP